IPKCMNGSSPSTAVDVAFRLKHAAKHDAATVRLYVWSLSLISDVIGTLEPQILCFFDADQ
ncbi:hypothetical protein, partial [Pseudomonas savastanoi]|uniref:hypothetical protein n=1 Tax=Pseudomonas savastanoi TaxID=29438 RepID=UPI001C80E841